MVAAAKRLVAQAVRHGLDAGIDLAHLPRNPRRAALRLGAAGPSLFQPGRGCGVHHPIGQSLPSTDFGALAPASRNEFAHGGEGIEIFDDHPRIENRFAVVEQQARHLAQRVGATDLGRVRPDVLFFPLGLDFFFGQHDAHLAHVRTSQGADEFHVLALQSMGDRVYQPASMPPCRRRRPLQPAIPTMPA